MRMTLRGAVKARWHPRTLIVASSMHAKMRRRPMPALFTDSCLSRRSAITWKEVFYQEQLAEETTQALEHFPEKTASKDTRQFHARRIAQFIFANAENH